jgi:hypothetical protein
MERIANSNARGYVSSHKPFKGSNLFAQWEGDDRYVVYSFGTHYPMFIWTQGAWFENEDKYSRTTSKHRSQTHPHSPTILLATAWMKELAEQGYPSIAKKRILTGELP